MHLSWGFHGFKVEQIFLVLMMPQSLTVLTGLQPFVTFEKPQTNGKCDRREFY